MTDDLTTFLLRMIEADEADARQRYSERIPLHLLDCASTDGPPGPFPCDCVGPPRVLAECEAKRRIVASVTDDRVMCEVSDEVLSLLALPYRDDPGYQGVE